MKIPEILEKYNLSQQEFADFTGIPRGRIAKWINTNSEPPKVADVKIISDVVKYFTTLTPQKVQKLVKTHRYILGNIEPIEHYNETIATGIVTEPETLYNENADLVPYYDVDIIAGTGELYDDNPNTTPAYYMDVPEFKGCRAYRVYSDSMEPLIDAGSIMFCKPVHNWRDFIEYGQIYAVEVNDNRRFIKQIRRGTKKEYFSMCSQNPQYDEFEVPISQIKNIWLIEGWMRKKTQ